MNIEQLQFITEVAKCGSLSKAAKNLHVSQPGISQAITSLEKELNVILFTRTKKGAHPTQDGQKFINKAKKIITHIYELKEMAQMQAGIDIVSYLRLSVVPSLLPTTLIKPLISFKNDYPKLKTEIFEKNVTDVINDIVNDKAEIGLIALYNEEWINLDKVEFEVLLEAEVCVCVSKNSKFATKKFIIPEDLINVPLALFNGDNTKHLINAFQEEYGQLNILFFSNNVSTIIKAVSEGLALTIMSKSKLNSFPGGNYENIIQIPLINFEHTDIKYGWIQKKEKSISPVASEFKNYVRIYIEHL
ncbi:LysR family transcriptional regulator [Bacillus sp. FJAT-45350]|uniref:LysR family transcriptional regulator n=1 Tax=Bacillus sp. FJAT-45350 TaxID=2011014 RepID=UPI000BB8A50C|nr:LysR family transcriptional regulator [Bacillus sp. FJAT-45350]